MLTVFSLYADPPSIELYRSLLQKSEMLLLIESLTAQQGIFFNRAATEIKLTFYQIIAAMYLQLITLTVNNIIIIIIDVC